MRPFDFSPSPRPALWRRLPSRALAASLLLTVALPASLAAAQTEPSEGPGSVPQGASGAIPVAPKQPAAPPAQGVTPPQLQTFVTAPYPPEAQKAQIEGNVVLQLDIDKDGKVTAATVVNPAGHGFDEAAVQAARQFVFAPALRNGQPIPARILYRYSFTLQEAPKTPGPQGPAAPPPPIKNLTGSVRSSEGDVPLAGARVTVRDGAGTVRETQTKEDGSWAFIDLPAGTYTVQVQAPGYQPLSVDEQVAKGEATDVVYRLPAEGTLEVVIRGKRPPREVTKRVLEKREIERIPGTNGDALRSLQNLPGVARPPSIAGILVVRGSSPQDTQVFFDGMSVPLVYHFGGLSSVVPTEFLERIDFYPGNFSAQYGRVQGGIVDVGLRSPKSDGKYHGMGQIDLIDARGLIEGPIPGLKGWNFAAGIRRSWFDTWLGPVLDSAGASVTAAPVYYDYQLFAENHPSARSTLRLGFMGSDDRLELLSKDASSQDATLSGNISLHTGFSRFFGTYQNDLTDSLSMRMLLAAGSDTVEFGVGSLYFKLNTRPILNRTEITQRLGKGATLHTGLDIYWSSVDINVLAPNPPRDGEPDPGPFATRPPLSYKNTITAYRPAGYVELELIPHRRLKLVPGVRLDYAKDTARWDTSPRLNARYTLKEGYPQTVLKAGVGAYTRPPQFQESYRPFGTPGLRSNRAIHYALGFEQDITRKIELSVEGFYKQLDLQVGRQPDESGNYQYDNAGSGYVVGGEFLLKYKPDDRFFGWIAYTISRAMSRNGPSDPMHLNEFDQTHILTALGSYRLGRGWEFGARFRLVSGNPDTPYVGGFYNANAGSYAALSSLKPFTERLPMFNQLDLRVDKRWDYGSWRLSTYLDVQNAYYAQNVEAYNYNYNFTQKTPITGLPIIPSIGVRGEF